MTQDDSKKQAAEPAALERALGYLNFSSGAPDPQFLSAINRLYAEVAAEKPAGAWKRLHLALQAGLKEFAATNATFRDSSQSEGVLSLVFDHVLPGYRDFHRDLLFHHSADSLFRPFFIGRVCESVLRQGGPWDETSRILPAAIAHLNDFLGHRPVPALESQQIDPNKHEFCRPIPLYIRGAGVSCGPEQEVVALALKMLEETDEDLLRRAYFRPSQLDELSLDPRAYDFDHPANKRPNYHFGQWDPHLIDHQGNFRRFVTQQVTLDALMRRLAVATNLPREEAVFEAAAVLAGTILMASGISGEGPATHDSNVSLAKLLPQIARYRDEFYERLFKKTTGAHAKRLRAEAAERRQPFGGARQHLNAELARQRASQLEHVHLARIFARLGFVDAAAKQARIVPCASARMLCQIDCLLTTGHLQCDERRLNEAAELLPQIMDQLHRGIACGAIVDPWNILGFDAHYSLFPALENSVRDHRADDLVTLMERIWGLYSRVWSEAAASDQREISRKAARDFQKAVQWWRQFAAHEVSSVEAVDAQEVYLAAERVAQALNVWHKGGAAAGDTAFWAPHAEVFDSPQAYAMVIDSLLNRRDQVASMALLVHWLGQASRVGLEQGEHSFHELAQRWLTDAGAAPADAPAEQSLAKWDLGRKFIDYLEANAEELWSAPTFSLAGPGKRKPDAPPRGEAAGDDAEDSEAEDPAGTFQSAYEGVVYRDSTADGVQGSIFEQGGDKATEEELTQESRRVIDRLAFLSTIARLWKRMIVSTAFPAVAACTENNPAQKNRLAALHRWAERAGENQSALANLLASVRNFEVPLPKSDHDSLVEYDRRRMTKESLLERIVAASVEMADAARMLSAGLLVLGEEPAPSAGDEDEQRRFTAVFAALLHRGEEPIRRACLDLWKSLARRPLLYVPLAKGGEPREIVAIRARQHAIQELLSWLPRLGMWCETCELLDVARQMERDHPVGPGAVTEFDELFKIGYKGIIESLVHSARTWPKTGNPAEDIAAEPLVNCLEQLTESMLSNWLAHSRTLRLSVLERTHDRGQWKKTLEFIERYGADLFTQRFLNLANLRAILHQGVPAWFERMRENAGDDSAADALLADIDNGADAQHLADQLALILEAIVENYGEYRDYNSTTTQSDRGELLYTLLDFLRLRTRYDRVCWNLKPVVLAHEILVRHGDDTAARVWRKALTDRIQDEADQYLQKLADLQKKHAMRMPTVADRLAERFIRPLTIDRIRALVEPAIAEARRGGACPKFELLEHETESLTREPTGVGLDVPAWLVALEEEVENALSPTHERRRETDLAALLPPTLLSHDAALRQLSRWASRQA